MAAGEPPEDQPGRTKGSRNVVRLRYDKAVTSYANLAFVTSSRQEVVVHFGLNVMPANSQQEVTVDIGTQVVMTYASAKLLAITLGNVIKRYEAAHGLIDVGQQPTFQADARA